MSKVKKIVVEGIPVSLTEIGNEDYICLTDMIKAKDGDFFTSDWLRNVNTLEYLSAWETMNNPDFNYGEYALIRQSSGTNTFKISVKEWVLKTNSIGITAQAGRYGGTYAHKDIAFNFGMWISPMFQLYIVKEYQRLKTIENDTLNLEWDIKRVLSKVNYHLHTDAILKHIIPKSTLPDSKKGIEYAKEADLLNLALFGCTAREWRDANPAHAKNKLNVRDFASIHELNVMSNLQSFNAEMIKKDVSKSARYKILLKAAQEQLEQLKKIDILKAVRRQNDTTYIEAKEKTGEELEQETSKNILDKNKKALSDFNKKLKQGLNYNPKDEK
ncbi:KilA-N domain-containing protein [Wocania ichthyoenteri]|uniref:KilA-N domain-containing protein n=1 Tax=Wocania ichthyoenteri TaxID=1230531 RepID=UPI00053DCA7F|nr:KilA-N domain-containing protein [Wocania ichthyoenteri]